MYTNRLKTLILLDFVLMFAMPFISQVYDNTKALHVVPYSLVVAIILAVWVAAKMITKAKYSHFDNIWIRFPSQLFVFVVLAAFTVIMFFVSGDTKENTLLTMLIIALFGYSDFRRDFLDFRYAKRFGMDKISSIKDLMVNKEAAWRLKPEVKERALAEQNNG